ncbi:MAG: molybdate ABC transporter substrate-binding protein [Acidimicrobiales bacterium]
MAKQLAVVVVGAIAVAGCGRSGAGSSRPETVGVFAAASLTEAFAAERVALARTQPGLDVQFDFAGSQILAAQIAQGAGADVFAPADEPTMARLVRAHLVEPPRPFAHNRLEIAVAPGNPRHVSGLVDLARPDLAVVLEDPSVPAGAYARRALARAGVTVHPKSLEPDVRAALAKVSAGEADAAIVYHSDIRKAADRVSGVEIPDNQNVIATYPIAVVKGTRHHRAAAAFVAEVLSAEGQRILSDQGFLPVAGGLQ